MLFRSGVVALHGDGMDADFAAGAAFAGQPQEVADGGPRGRGDHGDAVRVFGDGAFVTSRLYQNGRSLRYIIRNTV